MKDARVNPKKAAPVKRTRRRLYDSLSTEEEEAVKRAIEDNKIRKTELAGHSGPMKTEPSPPIEAVEVVSAESDAAEKEREAWEIIKGYIYKVSANAAIPFPIVDLAAVFLKQSEMLRKLAEIYEVDYDERLANEVARKVWRAYNGITMSAIVLGSAIKVIPVLGSALGIGSVSFSAAASTYTLGKLVIAEHR